jgi:hypothetical protein
MSNLVRVKSVGIYYIESGVTNPDDIEATYRKIDEDIREPIRFCQFEPEVDVFVDEYVDRREGVINIKPNQVVREVTGLRDFIARNFSDKRLVDIGLAYEAKLTTRSFQRDKEGIQTPGKG